MKNKKILIAFAGVPFIRGGAELAVESLHRELLARGYNAEILNIPFQWNPKNEIIKNLVIWRMLNLEEIAGQKIDLMIATKFPSYVIKHTNKITWLFHQHRAIYDLYGTPYSDFNPNNTQETEIRNQIINVDTKTLAESKNIYSIAQNTSNRLKQYNKLDSQALYHPPKHVGKYYNKEFGDYILSVGRLEGLKRIELLIRSLPYTDKTVKCIIAGTGGLSNYLKKITNDLNLNNRVVFLGFVSDEELLKLYAHCFAVYFAPFDEDYGYITLEAFLSKKPVITCKDSGGVMEFAEHGINALVAETPTPQIIGQYIDTLFRGRPSLCSQYGIAGYNKVKNITWDTVIDKLTETL